MRRHMPYRGNFYEGSLKTPNNKIINRVGFPALFYCNETAHCRIMYRRERGKITVKEKYRLITVSVLTLTAV